MAGEKLTKKPRRPRARRVGAHNWVVGPDQGFRAPSGDQESVHDAGHEDSASARIAAGQRPRPRFPAPTGPELPETAISAQLAHPRRENSLTPQDSVHEDSASARIATGQRPRPSFRHPQVSWWRNTMISRSFERPQRTAKRVNDTNNRYRMRHIGPQDASTSCLVSAHDHILGTHKDTRMQAHHAWSARTTTFWAPTGRSTPTTLCLWLEFSFDFA